MHTPAQRVAQWTAAWLTVAVLIASAPAAEPLLPTQFDRPDDARRLWQPMQGTPAVQQQTIAGRTGLGYVGQPDKLPKRASYDIDLPRRLGSTARIRLWIYCDRPEAFHGGTFYLRSGAGWYSTSLPLNAGWQEISLDRADFVPSGQAGPIEQADRVRVSFWVSNSPTNQPATVLMSDVQGESPKILMVRCTQAAPSADTYIRRTGDLLARLGQDVPIVRDDRLRNETLAGVQVVVFPLAAAMPTSARTALMNFVARGGKLLVCYTVPEPLGQLLGLQRTGWTKPTQPDAMARITFDRSLSGLPAQIVQNSWCATTVAPTASTRVIGRWNDGSVAVTAGKGGWFLAHVLTPGDDDAKIRFLATAIADMAPSLVDDLARGAIACVQETTPIVLARLAANTPRLSAERIAAVRDRLQQAAHLAQPADTLADTLTRADAIRRLLDEAGCLVIPAWPTPYRGIWCHSATGIADRAWTQTAKRLAETGIHMLFVNVSAGASAYYPSGVLATNPVITADGDPVAACLAACHAQSVAVHAWRVHWNLAAGPDAFIQQMQAAGRTQVSRNGTVGQWLAPSHPDNLNLERAAMLELLQAYPFDGMHMDYIRYPDSQHDYSAAARRAFETDTGETVRRWPAEVLGNGRLAGPFTAWRQEQITRLVRTIAADTHHLRPGIPVSAAVFGDWDLAPFTVGQNAQAWMTEGLLDFVCPMNYEADDYFAELLVLQRARTPKTVKLLAGIGVTARRGPKTAAQTAYQIDLARQLGADGIILFNLTASVADEILPRLRLGPLAEK